MQNLAKLTFDQSLCWTAPPISEDNGKDPMTIEISKESSKAAITSIQRYFSEHMDEEIGSLQAGALLGFFLKEIAPVIYNQAVADAQTLLQARVMELDIEVHEEEFQYWTKTGSQRKRHG